jgi:hypothetical protein
MKHIPVISLELTAIYFFKNLINSYNSSLSEYVTLFLSLNNTGISSSSQLSNFSGITILLELPPHSALRIAPYSALVQPEFF